MTLLKRVAMRPLRPSYARRRAAAPPAARQRATRRHRDLKSSIEEATASSGCTLVFTVITIQLRYGFACALLLTVMAGINLLDRKLETLAYEAHAE